MKKINIKKFFVFTLFTVSFLFALSAQNKEICIAVTSDVHGALLPWNYISDTKDSNIGFSKVATVLEKIKKENNNTILIDIGDLFQGNNIESFNNMQVQPMIQAINFMNYDLWILGNHDFNFGLEMLNRNIKGFKGQVVSANIKEKDSKKNFVLPYKIFDKDGVRIAVIGLSSPFIPYWESGNPNHTENLEFENPLDCAKETVKSLKGKYDVLIGAFHIGKDGEYELQGKAGVVQIAKEVPEFDIIFSGHDHSSYCEKINNTFVLGAGTQGMQVSFAKIQLTKQNQIWTVDNITAENILTKDFESSKKFEKHFALIHKKAQNNANQVIGKITADFIPQGADYITGKDEITTIPRAQIEATALLNFSNEILKYYANAEISEIPLLTLNSNLKKGKFKKKDIQKIFPYDDNIVGVNILGKNLLIHIEQNAEYFQTAEEGDATIAFNPKIRAYSFKVFSGINYEIDISKPVGQRIKNVTINGKPLDPNKLYKFATTNYRLNILKSEKLITDEDIYFNSLTDLENSPGIKELCQKYITENLKGIISPKCDNNWKIIGLPSTFNDPKTIEKIRSGKIVIPFSQDKRTPNVVKIKVVE